MLMCVYHVGAENTTVDRIPGQSVLFSYKDLCSVFLLYFFYLMMKVN